ncbi:MAG: hypothetical protein OXC31_26580 [Spirochaetaceae bacterium]|nr:hypothetical protein [Spirochaetaceae bacterium]
MVNGVPYPFERIRITLPAGLVVTIKSISYDGERKSNVSTAVNSAPRGRTKGPWKGMWKATITLFEFNALNQSLSETGILGSPPMPCTAQYGAEGADPIVDQLEIDIEKFSQDAKVEDDELVRELSGVQTKIPILNNVPAFVPYEGE